MVKTLLVDEQLIADGRAVLDVLQRARIKVNAALWTYDNLIFEEWSLLLVLPLVERIGFHEALKKVRGLLANAGLDYVNVEVMTPVAGYAQRLHETFSGRRERELFKEPMDSDGTLIDKGYLYFVS